MAALEMSKELDALFDRLKKGAELITPAEQSVFATAVKTRLASSIILRCKKLMSLVTN